MKTFLKTLIGGALGVGALYVVGKVCYEAGKNVAEVERQLEQSKEKEQAEFNDCEGQIKMDLDPVDKTLEEAEKELSEARADYWNNQKSELHKIFEDARKQMTENKEKPSFLQRCKNKFRNAKIVLMAKKTFDKSNKSPGILGSLLTNPDGARIEAFVRDGGVQINVKPRAA